MYTIKTNKAGFTLVELIIAIAILLILMGSMTPLLINSSKYLAEVSARTKYQNAASNIINTIRTQAGNTNFAGIYNASSDENAKVQNSTDLSGSVVSGTYTYERFYTADDYSAFYLESKDGSMPIITSKDLDGRLIKVDFECGTSTGTSDSRMAMLFVYVSVYNSSQQSELISYFGSSDKADNVDYYNDDGSVKYTDAPEPLYYQKSGIYLINIRENIEAPKSQRDMLLDAVESGSIKLDVNGSAADYNLSNEEYKAVYEEFVEYITNNDYSTAYSMIKSGTIGTGYDYTGSCLKYQNISKYEDSL